MKNSKRLLTLLLTLVMLVGVCTMVASAEDLIVPVTPAATQITINYDTSRVPALGTILPHSLEEGGSFTLPGASIDNLCWSLGNDVFDAGETFTYENMVKIMTGSSATFTFVAFIDEPITDEPPVYGEDKDPIVPDSPVWPPYDYPDYPSNGQKYKLSIIAYVDNYSYNCSYCNNSGKDNAYFNYSHLFQSKTCNYCYDASNYCYDANNYCYDASNYYYGTNSYRYSSKVSAYGDGYYTAGQSVRISARGATGYRFVGWYSDSNVRFTSKRSTSTTLTMPARNTTVYAVFAPSGYNTGNCNSYHNHTIRYTDGVSNKVIFNDIVKTVRHGAATPTVKDPVRPGYRFVGWSPKVSRTATECVTYVAQWSNAVAPQLTTEHVAFMKGVGNNQFCPDNKITRSEFAVLLYRLLDQKTVKAYYSSANAFSDVASDAWYNEAVSTLANAGVIDAGSTFRPTEYLTRAEMVTMLASFYTNSSCNTNYSCSFNDVPSNYWAYDAISMAKYNGWIKGYGANTFLPEATITRAEVAAVMNRVLDRDCEVKDTRNFVDNPKNAWFYQDVVEATIAH